jgi:DNA primase
MSFSTQFLDELRARCSLAGIIGRRVKLTKRSRDYIGLCPFHKEKSPSFNVVEDKGFYHCFGCGAHGDVIAFVMQTGNLGFPEAIEQLAGEAGLEVPRASPQERERAQRQLGLQGAMEAACVFFAEQLMAPAGRAGLAYFRNRGLDDATIRRFRLGYAPDSRDGLKRALAGKVDERILVEGGLLRQPEGGGASYDYFRSRVIFPIGDRSGRIIAFGGRTLGDGQPKYLNSPETPLFQKGRVLYGWAAARAGAAQEPSVIVTEGYMDVIALHRAGFTTAVAPLGTALTEMQIEELWKLAPEPILCFDGDAAGARAAVRAADRALPLLRPGLTLRFATLPAGEDPDTLIIRQGAGAMRDVLQGARPLGELIWTIERQVHPIDTPERRAAFELRLENRARSIADKMVADNYRRFFRDRLFASFAAARGSGSARVPNRRGPGRPAAAPMQFVKPERPDPRALLLRRAQEVIFATLLNHPALLDAVNEDFAQIEQLPTDLDKLRREILNVSAVRPDLDAASLRLHLSQTGFGRTVDGLLSPQVYIHAGFARPDAELAEARRGWAAACGELYRRLHLSAEIDRAERGLADDMTEASWAQFNALREHREEPEDHPDDFPAGVRTGHTGRGGAH